MTKHKHTPGPWRESDQDRGLILAGKNGVHIAQVAQQGMGFTAAANARLIAAAPDMLIVLQTIALHAPSLNVQGIRELCDYAIAKAQGEA